MLGSGLVLDGTFGHLIRFRTQPGAVTVPLAELAGVALTTCNVDVAGMVVAAEATELVSTSLRRSPAAPATMDTPAPRDAGGMREWLAFSPEHTQARRAVVIAGIVARRPQPPLAGFLRPLGRTADLVGHFHAMVFPYRPVPQRAVALRALVEKLLETQPLRSVGHLVFDDRGADSAGENALLRGLCWTARVTSVTAA